MESKIDLSEYITLQFVRGDDCCFAVGHRQAGRVYHDTETEQYSSLRRAVASLEARGYKIIPDYFLS